MKDAVLRLLVGALILGDGYVTGLVSRPLPSAAKPAVNAVPKLLTEDAPAAEVASSAPGIAKASTSKPARVWALSDVAKLLANDQDLKKSMLTMASSIADALLPDDATERWIASLPEGPQRNTAAMSYALKFMASHPDRAQRIADLVAEPGEQRKLSSALAAQLAMQDPMAAMNYANAMTDDRARLCARRTVLDVWGRTNVNGLLEALTAPGAQWDTEELVAPLDSLTAIPAEITQAALTLENAEARKQWLSRGMWRWALQDPQSASQWVAQLAPGEDRDTAISQMVQAAGKDDPVQSIHWAQTIGDPKQRSQSLERTFTDWLKNNSIAAESWAKQQTDPFIMSAIEAGRKASQRSSGWRSYQRNGVTLYELH